MEAVKHRMNAGKEGGVYFYRDSNMNEVDLLVKEEGEIKAFEVKSSMTYTGFLNLKRLNLSDSDAYMTKLNCPFEFKPYHKRTAIPVSIFIDSQSVQY